MSKNLLILGGLEEFVPLTVLAASRGIRPVVVDGYPGAPAKRKALSLGGAAYDVDVRDAEAVAEIAHREKAAAITTAYSDLLLECMVRIADLAQLPCHLTPAQLPWYRDKLTTNRTCEELGIPTPGSALLTKEFRDEDLTGLAFPMVIKPVDMYGSRGLSIVRTPAEIRERFDDCCSTSPQKRILAEEYADGFEFNIQCWVRHGKVHVLGLADREKTAHNATDIPLSTRNVYPSRLIRYVYAPALDALTRYIGRTGQKEGPLSMQFYWSKDKGFMVGEIAARFLGYEHELIEYACGFSVEELLLAAAFEDGALDGLLASGDPFGSSCAAVVYFHGRDGFIADAAPMRDAFADPAVVYSRLFYLEGERIGSPQTKPYVARCYVRGADRAEVDAATGRILARAEVLDKAGRNLLYPNIPGDYGCL